MQFYEELYRKLRNQMGRYTDLGPFISDQGAYVRLLIETSIEKNIRMKIAKVVEMQVVLNPMLGV